MDWMMTLVSGLSSIMSVTRSVYSLMKLSRSMKETPLTPKVMIIMAGFFFSTASRMVISVPSSG